MKQYTDKPSVCLVGPVRLSFLKVFKPEMNELSKREEYSAVLMIPKTPHKYQSDGKAEGAGITACIKAAAMDEWGKDAKGYSNPLKDGDIEKYKKGKREGEPKYPGHWFLTVKTGKEYPPLLIGPDRVPVGEGSEGMIKYRWQAGDWGKAKVNFRAYETPGGEKGVSAYLSALQFIHKDEPFGGGASADEFDDEGTPEGVVVEGEEADPFE